MSITIENANIQLQNIADGVTKGTNIIDGGEGEDTLSYFLSKEKVTVDLSTKTEQNINSNTNDTIKNIEHLVGSNYDDYLTGNSKNNIISGHSKDEITLSTGNDTLIDLGGDDTYIFNVGDGNDTITDLSGTDTIAFANISKEDLFFYPQ